MTPKRIIIADDHAIVRAGLTEVIRRRDDLEVVAEVANASDAMRAVQDPTGVEVGTGVEGLRKGLEALKAGQKIRYVGATGAFRFDKLKVDRAFVRNIDTGREARDIVRTIVSLARNLNMTTTAEGVERPEELRELSAEDVTEAQGFLLARPVTAEEVLHVLTKNLRSAA